MGFEDRRQTSGGGETTRQLHLCDPYVEVVWGKLKSMAGKTHDLRSLTEVGVRTGRAPEMGEEAPARRRIIVAACVGNEIRRW